MASGGELYPRVGFIVTNMSRPTENVVAFYNKRGTCEQWIREGKGAIRWTRLSCRSFAANAVRLQLHALAYNLGNFLRNLATPEPIVSHGRYVAFRMAEVTIPKNLFADIIRMIAELRPPPHPAPASSVRSSCVRAKLTGETRLDHVQFDNSRHAVERY